MTPAGYWPCACTRTNPITRKREVKFHPPAVRRCRRCQAVAPPRTDLDPKTPVTR